MVMGFSGIDSGGDTGGESEAIIKFRVSHLSHDVGYIPALDYVVGIVMCLGRFLFMVAVGEEGDLIWGIMGHIYLHVAV